MFNPRTVRPCNINFRYYIKLISNPPYLKSRPLNDIFNRPGPPKVASTSHLPARLSLRRLDFGETQSSLFNRFLVIDLCCCSLSLVGLLRTTQTRHHPCPTVRRPDLDDRWFELWWFKISPWTIRNWPTRKSKGAQKTNFQNLYQIVPIESTVTKILYQKVSSHVEIIWVSFCFW